MKDEGPTSKTDQDLETAESLRVWVELPVIEGETVTFRWVQSDANPFQHQNCFFFRYEGIDLTAYSVELLYEMFLALQLRVFVGYKRRVQIEFPTPLPEFSAAYWLMFHDATNITIASASSPGGYNPWRSQPIESVRRKRSAVFYGGGKDSLLATCLLSDLYGSDEVLLVQFVGPLRNRASLMRFLEERQERLMLEPARRQLGVSTQRVWTDFQANHREVGYPLRPHLELYTVGALPALLFWGAQLATFSISWSSYEISRDSRGGQVFRYSRSRPEVLATQSRHYQVTLGVPIEVTNIVLPFNSLLVHWLLAERYPEALKLIVSCTIAGVTERWCYQCEKCAFFAMCGLSTGMLATDFDYDYFLTDSRFIKKQIAYAESGVEPTLLGNVPWTSDFFIGPRSYLLGCHMLARIEPDELPIKLSAPALVNLAMLRGMYGNRLYPGNETVPRETLDVLGAELGPKITTIAAEHFEIADQFPSPAYSGNDPTEFQFNPPMEPKLATLDHIRT